MIIYKYIYTILIIEIKMIYYGSTCKVNNCNICYNYTHEANEYNCNYCEGNVDDWEMKCMDCGNINQIHFDCIHCYEDHNICEIGDICNTFIENVNIIKKWYKNIKYIKRTEILWKIAKYYTQKKYNPQGKFMKNFVKDF